jgi:hypothetical protein
MARIAKGGFEGGETQPGGRAREWERVRGSDLCSFCLGRRNPELLPQKNAVKSRCRRYREALAAAAPSRERHAQRESELPSIHSTPTSHLSFIAATSTPPLLNPSSWLQSTIMRLQRSPVPPVNLRLVLPVNLRPSPPRSLSGPLKTNPLRVNDPF